MRRGPGGVSFWRNPWWRWSGLSVGATTLAAVLVGFLWLPSTSRTDFGPAGLWAGICRAAGVPQPRWGDARAPLATDGGTTRVVLSAVMARPRSEEAAGHGATLALQRCSMCHGAGGIGEANAPNLAGQFPEVIVKQLADYRRGDRTSSIMQAMAGGLSQDDAAGLAAYYASLPPPEPRAEGDSPESTPTLVRAGDAMRNIAPCASCHGGIGRKLGAPWLEGMPKAYLVAQLAAFGTGARHNDSHAQMRNMARRLSSAEIDELARYYGRR